MQDRKHRHIGKASRKGWQGGKLLLPDSTLVCRCRYPSCLLTPLTHSAPFSYRNKHALHKLGYVTDFLCLFSLPLICVVVPVIWPRIQQSFSESPALGTSKLLPSSSQGHRVISLSSSYYLLLNLLTVSPQTRISRGAGLYCVPAPDCPLLLQGQVSLKRKPWAVEKHLQPELGQVPVVGTAPTPQHMPPGQRKGATEETM